MGEIVIKIIILGPLCAVLGGFLGGVLGWFAGFWMAILSFIGKIFRMDIDPQEVFNNTTGIFVLIFGVIGLVIGCDYVIPTQHLT